MVYQKLLLMSNEPLPKRNLVLTCQYSMTLLKTLKKENLLVMNNFSCLQYKSFKNTVVKGEIACNEQFLMSAVQIFLEHCGKRRISSFPTVFFTLLDSLMPFSKNLELSSSNSQFGRVGNLSSEIRLRVVFLIRSKVKSSILNTEKG